jgi:hypothetical protein
MITQTKWGIKIDCPHCGAKRAEVGFAIQFHWRWANKYGEGVRIFCEVCQWKSNVDANKYGVRVVGSWPPPKPVPDHMPLEDALKARLTDTSIRIYPVTNSDVSIMRVRLLSNDKWEWFDNNRIVEVRGRK